MNILFLTVVRITNINDRGIYTDLLRKFRDKGHNIFVVYPSEHRYKEKTSFNRINGITVLNIRSLNIQKTNLIEKGIATLMLEYLYLKNIKKYLASSKIDLVLYSTPPITFTGVIDYFKKKDQACAYLMLKDIFPQNAVDLGILNEGGILHGYFRRKEQKLYKISDYIGCMSPANVAYMVKHNSFIQKDVIEVCPNSIEPTVTFLREDEKLTIRNKYKIPVNTVVCLYGGNLGKPQGIGFLLNILDDNRNNAAVYFIIVGSGTESTIIANWFSINKPDNALLLSQLSQKEYDALLQSCDVGLIFLDPRFTIPNFPSRLLSYMEYSIPILAATDSNTDIGTIAENEGFGLASISGDLIHFNDNLQVMITDEERRMGMGRKARLFLENNYRVENSYNIIMNHFDAAI